jgi:hypothetical protein
MSAKCVGSVEALEAHRALFAAHSTSWHGYEAISVSSRAAICQTERLAASVPTRSRMQHRVASIARSTSSAGSHISIAALLWISHPDMVEVDPGQERLIGRFHLGEQILPPRDCVLHRSGTTAQRLAKVVGPSLMQDRKWIGNRSLPSCTLLNRGTPALAPPLVFIPKALLPLLSLLR